MSNNSARHIWRRRSVGAIAAVACIAAVVVAPVPAEADPGGVDAHAVLGSNPVWDGMSGHPGDVNEDVPANSDVVGGRECWRALEPGNLFQYFDVASDRIPEGARYANVEVTYFDEADGRFTLHYGSTTSDFHKADTVELDGTQTWRTHRFSLANIAFEGQQSHGDDFRIASWDASFGTSPTKVCVAEVSVSFAESADLAVTNDVLLLDAGEGEIRLESQATEVDWSVVDSWGATVAAGSAPIADNAGVIDTSDLPPGYYDLALDADIGGLMASASTAFAVLDELPDEALEASSPFGVSTHFGQSWDPSALELAQSLGYAHIRDELYWDEVELSPGEYTLPDKAEFATQAAELGIDLLFIAAYKNPFYDGGVTPSTEEGLAAFSAYASDVVTQLSDSGADVPAVEVYNEFNTHFNNGACGRTPQCYLPMLQTVEDRLRTDHPDLEIIGSATSGAAVAWNEELISIGGLEYMDALSVHPYRAPATPDGMTAELAQLNEAIAEAGHDTPLWITEVGWPTQIGGVSEAQQADFIVEANVLAQSEGVERLYWYDLLNDGNDPTYYEHNFGLFRLPTAMAAGWAPKPAAVAQAVMARELAGRSFVRAESIADGVQSFLYGDGDATTRVMWADEPTTIQLMTHGGVTVTDVYGTTRTMPRGFVEITVDDSPLYVAGPVHKMDVVDSAALTANVAGPVVAGEPVDIDVTVDRTHGRARFVPASVTLEVAGERTSVTVRAGDRQTVTVTVPPSTVGHDRFQVTAERDDGGTIAWTRVDADRVAPYEIAVLPELASIDPLDATASLTVHNHQSVSELTVSGASWQIGDESGVMAEPVVVPPRGSVVLAGADLGAENLWRSEPYSVNAVVDGVGVSLSGNIGLAPLETDDAVTLDPFDFVTHGEWKGVLPESVWGGPDDLSGTVRVTTDEENLIVHAQIVDEDYVRADDAPTLWEADSVQVSVSPQPPGEGAAFTELGFAELESGETTVYSFLGAFVNTTPPGATATVTREESTGTTIFEARIPWTSIGFDGPPTSPFGLSLLVNDNDGGERQGWFEWGSGIGGGKNPQLFNVMVPVD